MKKLESEVEKAKNPFGELTVRRMVGIFDWEVSFPNAGRQLFDDDEAEEGYLEWTYRRGIAAKALLDHLADAKASAPDAPDGGDA